MKRNIQKSLKEAFDSYLNYNEKEVYRTGLGYISGIYHATTYCKEYGKEKKTWVDIITQEKLEKEFYIQAFKDYLYFFKRVKHILSIGDYWNDDEWVLVLTHRLTWEMVKDFFHYRNLPFPDDLDLKGLCIEMKELSQTKKNKRVFEWSVGEMRSNSPLPFVDIWFEADRRDEYLKDK